MRRTVVLLCLAGLLPVIILGSGFGAASLINERSSLSADVEGRVHYSAALIGRELASDERATDLMAQSPAFDRGFDINSFRRLAERFVVRQPEWRRIRISDVAGRMLLSVPAIPSGPGPSGIIDQESFRWAINHQRPDIGRIVFGRSGTYAFPVRAPVIREGKARYVVTTVIPASALRALLVNQKLPQGWHAEIVDGGGRIVASTRNTDGLIGSPAAKAALEARTSGRSYVYTVDLPGGSSDIAMWSAIPSTNWTVHVAAPSRLFSAPWHRALLLITGAAIVSLGLSLVLARLLFHHLRETRQRETAELQGQRMEALGRLTGGVAHDFNNLLTPIVGGLDLLKRRTDDPKSLKYINAAIQSADRAKTLVGRLLAYSRRQPLAPQLIDVAVLISGLLELLRRSTGPTYDIKLHVERSLPSIYADPAQLELAILNLAINARDAAPNGGTIALFAEDTYKSNVDAPGLKGHYLGITVADSGTGMDAETLQKATEPFFTTKPSERGTGLGLSLVQDVAAQSGGMLQLDSKMGHGTRATIWLPVHKEPQSAQPDIISPASEVGIAPVRGVGTILLVDDEADVRATIADALDHAGYSIIEAGSVTEALDRLSRERVDLVITDYLMPGGSGADLIKRMRVEHPTIAVILLSGYISSMDDLPSDILQLRKPFNITQLEKMVGSALS